MEETHTTETLGPIVAGEAEIITEAAVITEAAAVEDAATLHDLDQRMQALESAMEELRTVRASATSGRKTMVADAVQARATDTAGAATVDEALRSLSIEQRIAVKSGLLRAGLLQ